MANMLVTGQLWNSRAMTWNFDHTYSRLPAALYSRVTPVPVPDPRPVLLNVALASELGLDPDDLQDADAIRFLSGNDLVAGSEPLAQAYAGHQFGHFALLGDGRAHLLGEHLTPDGRRVDIQLKGSGQTPYSRRGDGRAALGPMLREYIISEAMHALGIPTTRSLAVLTTGEFVFREGRLPGAILARIAASHIRVGTFEYAAFRDAENDDDEQGVTSESLVATESSLVRALADYALARHFPEQITAQQPYSALLEAVLERQAALLADWMGVGFIHGVMNTDNMAISGETIDYGPCAFMDHYDPATVFSSIDRQGRYAYGNQPRIAHWNLARFAETLLPLLHPEPKESVAMAEHILHGFPARFGFHWRRTFGAKLGLAEVVPEDSLLIEDLLAWLHRSSLDFTNSFRALAHTLTEQRVSGQTESPFFGAEFQAWHARWTARLDRQQGGREAAWNLMVQTNPVVIPRNHRVEAALSAAVADRDLAPLQELLRVLADPFDPALENTSFVDPPGPEHRVYQTFCGT